jgi:hypothetical protein
MNTMNTLHITTLADKAVLVRLTRGVYQPYAFDQSATDLVEQTNGVTRAGRFNKRLFKDCSELTTCNNAFGLVYTKHISMTLPWLDDGLRMLPSWKYESYRDTLRPLIQQAEATADELQSKWDRLVVADMTRLGPLANSKDYPINVRDRYYIDIKFLPVPMKGDFRVDISDEDRASLDRALVEAENNATKYLISEVLKPLKHAVSKLNTPIGADGSVFRDSLVDNVLEAVERAAELNIASDPTLLAEIVNVRSCIHGVGADALRESDVVRSTTASKLDEVTKRLSAYMATV